MVERVINKRSTNIYSVTFLSVTSYYSDVTLEREDDKERGGGRREKGSHCSYINKGSHKNLYIKRLKSHLNKYINK